MTRSVVSSFAVLAATAASIGGPAAPEADAGTALTRTERNTIRIINHIRARHGRQPLHASRGLGRAADAHSRDMLVRNFFSHTSSDGTPFELRVRRYAQARHVGETLALWTRRRGGASAVVRMWMNSAPHRALLLDGSFRRIGLARRWGTLGSAGRAVVTADFATAR